MKKIIWPAVLSIVGFLTYFFIRLTGTGFIYGNGLKYLLAGCYACLGMSVVRFLGFLFFNILYRRRTRREAPALLRIMFSMFAYSILFTLILGLVLEYDVTGLVATSAVLSVVLGFALQDTLGNFFAGASLHVEQPFKIKDGIKFREYAGEVDAVSWRTTTIHTNSNTYLIFPNSLLARDSIEVFPYNRLHRHSVLFSASYSISPQTVITAAEASVRDLPHVSYEIEPTARITGFGESSVNYELLYWMKDYMKVAEAGAKIKERIWYAFYRDNISMPFPTRHVLIERAQTEPRGIFCDVDYRGVIDKIDVFEPLSSTERASLVCSNGICVYGPGEYMVRCGEAGESMFIIGKGKAEVRVSSNGAFSTVAVLETGSFFGEMSLFSGEPRSADVVAVDEVEVLEIRKPSIQKLLVENAKLVEVFSTKVAERHAGLERHANSVRREEIEIEQENILQRMKRFFNLS